jgi:hypothetical protein
MLRRLRLFKEKKLQNINCDAYPQSRGLNRHNLTVRLKMDSRCGVGFDAVYLRL